MLSVKSILQTQGHCGPVCLKMIFHYYGKKVSERKIATIGNTTRENGTSPSGLIKAAKYFGFNAEYKENSSFMELRKLIIKQKIPVIVAWFSGHESHYSVAIGIDNKNIYMADPEFKEIKHIPLVAFEKIWFDYTSEKKINLNPIIIIRK